MKTYKAEIWLGLPEGLHHVYMQQRTTMHEMKIAIASFLQECADKFGKISGAHCYLLEYTGPECIDAEGNWLGKRWESHAWRTYSGEKVRVSAWKRTTAS